MEPLSPKQQQAHEWLVKAGKSGPKLAKRNGFQETTLRVLVRKGYARMEQRSMDGRTFPIFYAIETREQRQFKRLKRIEAAARMYFREFNHLASEKEGGEYPEQKELREALGIPLTVTPWDGP